MTALSDLRALHAAVLTDLRAHYGAVVATIEAYDALPAPETQDRLPVRTPALLLSVEMQETLSDDDDGTDRQPLRLTCNLDCILSARTAELDLELREFARDVMARVRHNRWGLHGAVRVPDGISARPATLDPEQDGYGVMRVSWQQLAYCGTSAWDGAGTPPDTVYIGRAPWVGADVRDSHYRQVAIR